MAVPKRKISKARRDKRRASNIKMTAPNIIRMESSVVSAGMSAPRTRCACAIFLISACNLILLLEIESCCLLFLIHGSLSCALAQTS